MNKPIFRIGKSSYYSSEIKDLEEFSVYMNSKPICNCLREELLELRELLNLALNDQKVNVNEKGGSNE